MSFLYPAFLVGGLAIALPIVLHLLRRDVAPEVPFTAVRLLQKAPIERAERRRLRELILLAARIAALLLLATVFARPYVQGAAPAPVRVVAIDRSYSMGTPGVFARALDLARAAIGEASTGERIAVVAFDDRAELLAEPGSGAEARAALDGLTTGVGATRFGPVFQLATELAAGAAGRLVVITDLQRSGWESESPATLPAAWTLDVRDAVKDARQNVAVTAASVRPDRIVASVQNGGSASRAGKIRVVVDGREGASSEYAVPAGATVDVSIPFRAPAVGALSVVVDDPEGLPADNTRYVALGSSAPATSLVITGADTSAEGAATKPAAFYLSRALSTVPGEHVEVVPGARVATMSVDELSSRRGIALLSTRGLDRPGRERLMAFVRGGGGLFLAAGSELEVPVLAEMTGWQPPLAAVEQTGPLTLAATDVRHPIFRPFGSLSANLGQARFDRAWRVSPDGWSVIARFSNGTPALLERSVDRGRIVLFASDFDRRWNDLPLHPAFVPMAVEALRYVGGSRAARDFTVAQAPPEAHHQPGVFRSADGRPFAVNVDTQESALAAMAAVDFDRQVQRQGPGTAQGAARQAQQTEAHQSYWQYGLVLMIATLIAESVAGRA